MNTRKISSDDVEVSIIKMLKTGKDDPTSGQAISTELGISRNAVWKHIENLRSMGYSIDASTKKGYTLSTPLPFNATELLSELKTEIIGTAIYYHDTLTSTNDMLGELARSNATEGTILLADSQTIGRGRAGRNWHSPEGKNIYTSILLRPRIHPQMAQSITLLAAVAVAETIKEFVPSGVEVKWPNDVLINERKVAGILTEMSSDTDMVKHIVLGIGINVNSSSTEYPEELKTIATSILDKNGSSADRLKVAGVLYSRLEKWYKIYLSKGPAPHLDAWKEFFTAAGKQVKVSGPPEIEGLCMGIDDDGALLIRSSSGEVIRAVSGEMSTNN